MLKFIRVILFIPAMYLGTLMSALVSTIFNIPFLLLDHLSSRFGDWGLGALIPGLENISLTEGLAIMFSGFFMSLIGLFFALNVFPYKKHRNKVVYVLFALLAIECAAPHNIEIYNGYFLYFAKLAGLLLGFGITLITIFNDEGSQLLDFIDNKLSSKQVAEQAASADQEATTDF